MIENLDPDITQIDAAHAFVEIHADHIRFEPDGGTWLVFDPETGWEWDHHQHSVRSLVEGALNKLEDTFPKELADDDHVTERTSFLGIRRRAVRNLMKHGAIGSIIKTAEGDKAIHCKASEIDAVPHLLGTPKGILDLKTGKLSGFDRKVIITRRTGVAPRPKGSTKRFVRFISEVLGGDPETIAAFQRLAGYMLTGETHHQQMWLLVGHGSNGKSTLLSVLQKVMGTDYSQQAPEAVLMSRPNPGGTSGELVRLKGVRCAILTETAHGQALNEERVKQLVAADRIAARELYKGYEEFVPQAKFLLATNHLPVVRGSDDGIWRRLVVVPFRQRFEVGSDPTLVADLNAEREGILSWIVEGAKAWYAEKKVLPTPEAWKTATTDFRSEQDSISQFIVDCCESSEDAYVGATQLYDAFTVWCLDQSREPLSQQDFGSRLMTTGKVERRRKGKANRHHYFGLRLAQPANAAPVEPESFEQLIGEFELELSNLPGTGN